LRLERLHRFAPRSEKLRERIFNEAEQAAAEGEDSDDAEAAGGYGVAGRRAAGAEEARPQAPAGRIAMRACRA
jgi:hypothetical protein